MLWDFFLTRGHGGAQQPRQRSASGPGTRLPAPLLAAHSAKPTSAQTPRPLLAPLWALCPEVPLLCARGGQSRSLLSSPLLSSLILPDPLPRSWASAPGISTTGGSSQNARPGILAPRAAPVGEPAVWQSAGVEAGWGLLQTVTGGEDPGPASEGTSPTPGLALQSVKCCGVSPPVSFPLCFWP